MKDVSNYQIILSGYYINDGMFCETFYRKDNKLFWMNWRRWLTQNKSNIKVLKITPINFILSGTYEISNFPNLEELDWSDIYSEKYNPLGYLFTNCPKLKTVYCHSKEACNNLITQVIDYNSQKIRFICK